MTRRVIGLDLSLSATGVARVTLLDGDNATVPELHVEKADDDGTLEDRLNGLAARLTCINSASLVAVEAPILYGAHAKGAISLIGLNMLIRCRIAEQGIPLLVVDNGSIKKYATGNGNANKDLVRDAARDRFGLPPGVTSDECDALWACAIGCALLDRPIVDVPAKHRGALVKLELPDGVVA